MRKSDYHQASRLTAHAEPLITKYSSTLVEEYFLLYKLHTYTKMTHIAVLHDVILTFYA